jgi:hypothetical protein
LAVSIKDVASRAKVPIATVSYVLNGTRGTRPQTQQKVLAEIQDLRYAQNQSARNLATGRSTLLGLIVSDIRNPFFPEVTAAFQDRALLHNMETLNPVKRLVTWRVAAVAILTLQIDPSVMDSLAKYGIADVYLDLGRVDKLIGNILTGLGHTQIAYAGGPPSLHSPQRRKKAFLKRAAQMGIDPSLIVDADFTYPTGLDYGFGAACGNRQGGFSGSVGCVERHNRRRERISPGNTPGNTGVFGSSAGRRRAQSSLREFRRDNETVSDFGYKRYVRADPSRRRFDRTLGGQPTRPGWATARDFHLDQG